MRIKKTHRLLKKQALLWTLLLSMVLAGCGAASSEVEPDSVPQAETQVEVQQQTTENPNLTLPEPDSSGSDEDTADASHTESDSVPTDSTFEVHFIDVGQADAALVLCDDSAMLIDGGNKDDSSLIYSYLKEYDVSHLDYLVATHGHEDHAGGLASALNYATVDTAYCSVTDYDSAAFDDFVKYLGKQGKSITVPQVGESFQLGSATVKIVGVNSDDGDHNNTSIVLRIKYGDTSFLFTGDAEREAEQVILDAGYDIESTVLKVGHHGSESSTSYVFLREVAPQYAVISVGEGNTYGHPTEAALSRLRDADVDVYRTDMQGTIICTSDGSDVSFSVSKNPNADTLGVGPILPSVQGQPSDDRGSEIADAEQPIEADEVEYIGNKNPSSMKFHYPSCSSVSKMKESNKFYFAGTRDEILDLGYTPCGNCKP